MPRSSHSSRRAQAAQAAGNPLYVRELTDSLVREDRVRVDRGVAEVSDGALGQAVARPVSLAAAIEGRLGFLSPEAVAVLRVAALLGARFSVRDLRIVAGRSAGELAAVVAEAVAAGVLAESGMELVFRHGLIAQALAERTPAGLRAELHRDAARALAAAGVAAERVAAQLLAVAGEADGWMVEWLAENAGALVQPAGGARKPGPGRRRGGASATGPGRAGGHGAHRHGPGDGGPVPVRGGSLG